MRSIRTIQSFFVGLAVVYLTLAAFGRGFVNAAFLIVLSVVCTAGVSLVFWIPLCWGVGWVTLVFARWVARQIGASGREEGTGTPMVEEQGQDAIAPGVLNQAALNNRLALDDYIRRAVQLEHPYERICTALLLQGWSEAEISQAYENVTTQT